MGAHPDDVEIFMGGTLRLLAKAGKRVGILDLTRGERGTRGSAAIRNRESACAAKVLGLCWRGSVGLPDGRLAPSPEFRERIAEYLRDLRPEVVLSVASDHRHPDHTAAEALSHDACFIAGLRAMKPGGSAPFRPRKFLLAAGFRTAPPNLIVDITSVMREKKDALRCYRSQFGPTGWRMLDWIEGRARSFGMLVRVPYGEGFIQREPFLTDDVTRLAGTSF